MTAINHLWLGEKITLLKRLCAEIESEVMKDARDVDDEYSTLPMEDAFSKFDNARDEMLAEVNLMYDFIENKSEPKEEWDMSLRSTQMIGRI